MMSILIRLYRHANILSLDVAVGAMVSAFFFSRILNAPILPWGYLTLGTTVWIIYTADHLLDAWRLKRKASSGRHCFHQEYFGILLIIWIMALLTDLVFALLIRRPVFMAGLILAVIAAIYLLVQSKLRIAKEFSGGLLYVAGVALPALVVSRFSINMQQAILITQFGITVLINLLLFSFFDLDMDLKDGHHSFATVIGAAWTRSFLVVLFLLNGVLIVFHAYFFRGFIESSILVMAMNIILCSLFLFRNFFKAHGNFRLLGDAVFLLPLYLAFI